jgi:hypothetical protein
MESWNLILPRNLNQSEAVEALALSLASSFEVADTDRLGQPTSIRTRGSGPAGRAFSIRAGQQEFARVWALAVAVGEPDSPLLNVEVQHALLEAVQSYMEVHDLGYMPAVPPIDQLELDFEPKSAMNGATKT